jgi:Mrp family chromosome partitioning ATPase
MSPPKDTSVSRSTVTTSAEQFRFEPTVFGAVRRYSTMVLAIVVVATVAAIGYSLKQPKIYRAQASITAPQPVSLQAQQTDPGQYLDSQALLLQSPAVARRAASIANLALHSNTLTARDFSAVNGSMEITPPTTSTAGNYGASIIVVSFAGPSPTIAQVGLGSLIQAYLAARAAAVSAQGDVAITGINHAIDSINRLLTSINKQLASASATLPAGSDGVNALRRERQVLLTQRGGLITARTQAVANQQYNVAQKPTVATQLATLANHKWKRAGAIGLVIGILTAATLAFVLASRRRGIADRQDPAALYRVPLIGEIPAFDPVKARRSNGTPAGGMLPVAADPHSGVAEAFRFVATSVERIHAARGRQLSLVFVSPLPGGGKSTVVANIALALAEGGTRVLVVDTDSAKHGLTNLLLPGALPDNGFEQVLARKRALADCIYLTPFNRAVAVLGSGSAASRRVTGAARAHGASALLADAKANCDLVLIDSPALLQIADAAEVVEAADAAIIVLSPNELIQDHLETVDRLKLLGAEVVGYIYNRAPVRAQLARYRRNGSSARPAASRVAPGFGSLPLVGESRLSPESSPHE